jgi:hypothetical protein
MAVMTGDPVSKVAPGGLETRPQTRLIFPPTLVPPVSVIGYSSFPPPSGTTVAW